MDQLSLPGRPSSRFTQLDQRANDRLARRIVWLLIVAVAANQYLIGSLLPKQAGAFPLRLTALFQPQTAAAATIVGPTINQDGKTTSLVEQPTISSVPADPHSGDDLADAKVVMLATGKPDYAPDGAAFDDPVQAEKVWGTFEDGIQLTGADLDRYNRLIEQFLCSYCCGGAANVTRNKNCGCAHAIAARGYFKYMIQKFGDTYSDEQLMGEGFRWQAIWYPRGAIADYLLAIGRSDALPHQPHGGAGADGLHGLGGQ